MDYIIRRLGKGGPELSSGRNTCPDILELESGDVLIIGTDVTKEYKDILTHGAKCANYESIVKIPKKLLKSAKEDISNC